MNTKRLLFRFLCWLLCWTVLLVQLPSNTIAENTSIVSGDYVYTVLDDETVSIISYTGKETNVIIPSQLDGFTVSALGTGCFEDNRLLQTVILPSGLDTIGSHAFEDTINLSNIFIPDSVIEIQDYAFSGCTFSKIVLPDSITTLGVGVFKSCPNLETVNYPKNLSSIRGQWFRNCPKMNHMAVPEGITSLPNNVFQECDYLVSVSLPSTLTKIGSRAFDYATSLSQVNIPESVTEIGDYAFAGCAMTSIILPNGLTTLGKGVFKSCSKLTGVHLPPSLNKSGGSLFGNCPNLKQIIVPEGFTVLPDNMFYDCSYLTEISLPSTLEQVGTSAFDSCSSLQTIQLPENVTTIGRYAFAACKSLKKIYMPSGITSLPSSFLPSNTNVKLYCPLNSQTMITLLEQNLPFESISKVPLPENCLLNRELSSLTLNTSNADANGCIQLSICCIPIKASTNSKVILYIPDNATLVDGTLTLNQQKVAEYSIEKNKLSLPIPSDGAMINMYIRIGETKTLNGYAMYCCDEGNEIIDSIYEFMNLLTLSAPEVVADPTFNVSGFAPAGSDVVIFLDNNIFVTTKANRSGCYTTEITLPEARNIPYTISASCNALNAVQEIKVRWEPSSPELTELIFYHKAHDSSNDSFVLYDANTPSFAMQRLTFQPHKAYSFSVAFKNADNLDRVFIVSTRNNIKSRLPAEYDSFTQKYVTHGYFNNDPSYVPGQISVEFDCVRQTYTMGEEFDYNYYLNKNPLLKDSVTKETASNNDEIYTIDLGKVNETLNGQITKLAISLLDETAGTSFEDSLSYLKTANTVLSYIIPGNNNQKFFLTIDYSDPESYVFFLKDGSSAAKNIYKYTLSVTDSSSDKYLNLYSSYQQISNCSTLFGNLSSIYGFYKDYDSLCDEIYASSSIKDKSLALKQAQELRTDQIAFTLLTTVLPMCAGGGPAGLLFTAMLSTMGSLSNTFWDLRIAHIKGQKIQTKWAVDPSGYLYEAVTNNRISGATVSAYWVEYDESNSFWENEPQGGAGILWEAEEWNQQNPIISNMDGAYAWDVPEGWWQIRATKEGYELSVSPWLSVIPPRTEVNLSMISLKTPEVDSFIVYPQSCQISFTKYMVPDGAQNLTLLDSNNQLISCNVSWPVNETNEVGTIYARTFTLTPTEGTLQPQETYTLLLSENTMMDYAGISIPSFSVNSTCQYPPSISIAPTCTLKSGHSKKMPIVLQHLDLNDISVTSDDSFICEGTLLNENGEIFLFLEGRHVGVTTVTLSSTTLSTTVNVTIVEDDGIPELSLPYNFSLLPGLTLLFPETSAKIQWKSSNSDVLIIDEEGRLITLCVGTAILYASVDGFEQPFAQYTVTVEKMPILTLPASLNSLDSESFLGTSVSYIRLNNKGLSRIGSKAFANCSTLKLVEWICCNENLSISADAFYSLDHLIFLIGNCDVARQYADRLELAYFTLSE